MPSGPGKPVTKSQLLSIGTGSNVCKSDLRSFMSGSRSFRLTSRGLRVAVAGRGDDMRRCNPLPTDRDVDVTRGPWDSRCVAVCGVQKIQAWRRTLTVRPIHSLFILTADRQLYTLHYHNSSISAPALQGKQTGRLNVPGRSIAT